MSNEVEGDKGKGKNRNANVMFAEVENAFPRNSEFSLDETSGGSGEIA